MDQEGAGFSKGLPYGTHADTCPVRALRRWLDAAEITSGPLFRPISRYGTVGTAALHPQGSERLIMAQTGHTDVRSVRRYIREGSLFRENAAGLIGL